MEFHCRRRRDGSVATNSWVRRIARKNAATSSSSSDSSRYFLGLVVGRVVGGRPYRRDVQMRYRFRIEPTPAQQRMLARVFGCCRVVFNDALRVRDEAYRAGEKLSDSQIQRHVITQAKKTNERAWLCEVPSVALVQSVNDSRRAWRNFFDSHKEKRSGHCVGRPRMKSKKYHRQSFRLTRNGFSLRASGRLSLAKVGEVRVRWSCQLPSKPSSVTIIRETDGHYYASFVVDVEPTPLPAVQREAGVDVGVARLATVATSDGQRTDIANAKHLDRKLRKLRRWSGRSPGGRRDRRTETRRGARLPSRTTRWLAVGGTISTSRLWRWFATTK
jgi:transposase